MNQVYLSLGSNLDDRMGYLKKAIELLKESEQINVMEISSLYETSPVGGVEQSEFLNLVLKIETNYHPDGLLAHIHTIEKNLDRKREVRWGPRTIDIDILYYNEERIYSEHLEIPHRELGNRLFVLVPMLDVCENDFYQIQHLKERVSHLWDSGQRIKKLAFGIELDSVPSIEEAVTNILKQIGDDPKREGLLETPKRVAKMYREILSSQREEEFKDYKIFTTDQSNNSQMILINDIPFYSMCEHHMLPFFGNVHVAYIPNNGKIIGLSKIPRLVDFVSKKLNVQENITRDIAVILEDILSPKGVAVVVDARHMCVEMRGVRKGNCVTRTSFYSGQFDEDFQMRNEFLQTLNNKK